MAAAVAISLAAAWSVGELTRPSGRASGPGTGRPSRKPILERVGTLPDVLHESSGVAVSRHHHGVLWTHNDSGDGPRLYAIDERGSLLSTITVEGASAVDWEDIALGPCPRLPNLVDVGHGTSSTEGGCLYIADTGNNDRSRTTLTVYVVPEPSVVGDSRTPATVTARSFGLRFPDVPEDCEAIAVLPNGDVIMVPKGRSGTIKFFGLTARAIEHAIVSGDVVTANDLGATGIVPDEPSMRLVTGAAISPDGARLAVRTYDHVFFYRRMVREDRRLDTKDGKTLEWQAEGEPCATVNEDQRGEAIDYLDQNTLILTAEAFGGRPATVHRLRCP